MISLPETTQGAFSAKLEKTPLRHVEGLAAEHFGVVGKATSLSSERDETFLVRAEDGAGYVLKIAGPTERFEVLRFQTEALLHLAEKQLSLPLPHAVASRNGATLLTLQVGEHKRIVRMLTFLDGVQLHRVPRSPAQMRSLGTALATLGEGLSDFRPVVPQQQLLWDLCNAALLRDLVPHVGAERQMLVLRALDAFDRLAHDGLASLPRQVIHNDFNPHNILVSPDKVDCVTGVIDFGDMVEAPLVNDLAVALSYQVSAGRDLEDLLTMLRAYDAIRPLGPLDVECLPTLLRTRLAMSLTIAEWRAGLHPENRDYILRNHAIALAGLNRLADRSDAELVSLFRQRMGEPA